MKEIIWSDFLYAGISSSLATVFTNPLEVVKIRMQLQGELGANNQHTYRNIPQAILQIARNDGFSGLQKGLTPSLFFQFFLNAFRLGIYTTADQRGWTRDGKTGHVSIIKSAFWGATGGFIGAAVSNPFFMVLFLTKIFQFFFKINIFLFS